MALFTKLLRSVSGRALPKPFCYEDVHRTTYKATSLYLRFPGLLNSRWPTTCSVREQNHLTVCETDELRDHFPFHWPERFSQSFHPLPHLLPPAQCARRLHWVGRAHRGDSRKADLASRAGSHCPVARPGGLTDPPRYSGPRVLQAGLLQNLRSCCLTSGLLQNWGYYSLPRSQPQLDSWLHVASPCLSLLPVLLPGLVKTFSWPPDLTSFSSNWPARVSALPIT